MPTAATPQMLCSGFGKPPPVALCITGIARTFPNAITHRSLLENFIESLGAPVTTFAYLKLRDSRGARVSCSFSGYNYR